MSLKPLDYESQETGRPRPPHKRVVVSTILAAMVILLVNAGLLRAAAIDHSWGALGIMMIVGPITNVVLAIVCAACMPIVKRLSRGAAVSLYMLVSLLLPVAAIPVDFMIIGSMDLHGC